MESKVDMLAFHVESGGIHVDFMWNPYGIDHSMTIPSSFHMDSILVVTKSDVTYITITWHNLNVSYLQFHFLTDQYLYCHADDPTQHQTT